MKCVSFQCLNPLGSSCFLITKTLNHTFRHESNFFFILTRNPNSSILIPVMKLKEIKNGSIYYNTKKNRPERVISNSFSSSRVVTEFHGKNQSAVSTRNIRLANSSEVEKYLNKNKKSNLITFFGKLSCFLFPKKLA